MYKATQETSSSGKIGSDSVQATNLFCASRHFTTWHFLLCNSLHNSCTTNTLEFGALVSWSHSLSRSPHFVSIKFWVSKFYCPLGDLCYSYLDLSLPLAFPMSYPLKLELSKSYCPIGYLFKTLNFAQAIPSKFLSWSHLLCRFPHVLSLKFWVSKSLAVQ